MGFNIDIENVLNGLAKFDMQARATIGLYVDTSAKKLEAHAKKNAPWKDDTGLSRKTIEGGKEWQGEVCNTYISGNTNHFPFLELCHDKQYAILWPTVNKLGPALLSGLNRILEK